MSSDPRHQFGQWGEEQVAEFLRGHGFKVLERGFRCRFGEIDIIAAKNGLLVFCEVKSRRRADFTTPLEAVTPAKRRRLIKTAGWYLQRHDWDGELRFDVISVLAAEGRKARFEWIEDAFPWE